MKIKGFDKNLCGRGMQFEVGKTYDTGAKDADIKLCSDTVFHYCDNIQNVHTFYSCNPCERNRFCEIEVLGAEVSDGVKCGSNKIKIAREIIGNELKSLVGMVNGNTGLFNSGSWNSEDRNSGNWNSGSWNSGDRNSGNWNSGDRNSGNGNSGNRNSGDRNSGSWNSGNGNSGNRNSGNWNSGDRNSGDGNSGNRNSGSWNSGDFNSCNNSNGIFCNQEDDNIRIFNKPSGMSLSEFRLSEYFLALMSVPFELTFWDDTENELKRRTYKEACAIWWSELSEYNKKVIQQIPNFDPDVFFDITGIRVGEE